SGSRKRNPARCTGSGHRTRVGERTYPPATMADAVPIEVLRGSLEERILRYLLEAYPVTTAVLARDLRIPEARLGRVLKGLVRRHRQVGIPPDSEIRQGAPPSLREAYVDVLRVKPTRSASGVAVVAVMTPPHACPHGTCVYCPGGLRVGTPQSYTGSEPAARRGAHHRY